ncbi:cobalt-precorrin-5B (C(1))-methyltransferase CbiD [Tissierella pigra]|uniref:Cobalt-precorrin-5B C(1)-methyltransferase n=1 Tax=Tissierella pigra TaxID=2607614 RepID=A0A6N7XWM1_9FIRM|nr:cobalt-precorrin-5B (C(1))-methyltransferase CbiD [Tissierella pigra]MBU5425969.1 cobalt-precorrin-5B (C(1))-methyltransferase CbiD [Tissierella pigra]MSU00668.1 cobalamin biosynthesis protein CbiD [Tissierella pigra]
MTLDLYVVKEGKSLRCGYTTGSCAAAAAKAAAIMLEEKGVINYVEIDTPANIRLKLEVTNPVIEGNKAICSIVKDAGDDPDNTDGIEIYAEVSKRNDGEVFIEGGEGIGRIKRKGLFGEVGEAAINPVPRKMIEKEVREVSNNGYDIVIFAPQGEEIGKKTFNKNIGIEGGISIIGTKGIVYPMSEEALIKTIYMEVDMIEEDQGKDNIVLVPGNYGEKIGEELGIKEPKVKISNFIGDSLLYVYNKGFKSMTLIGHIGKFAKLAIGVFNTHSKVCDGRMEAFIYYLSFMGAPVELLNKVNNAVTAEEGLNICIEAGYGSVVKRMEKGAEERIRKYLKDEDYNVKVIIYSMERGTNIC